MKKVSIFVVLLFVVVSLFADGFGFSRSLSLSGEYMYTFLHTKLGNESSSSTGSQVNGIITYNEYFNKQSTVGAFVEVMPLYKLLSSTVDSVPLTVDSSWHTLSDQLVINGGITTRCTYNNNELIANLGVHYERAELSGITMTCLGMATKMMSILKVVDNFAFNITVGSVIPLSYRMSKEGMSISPTVSGGVLSIGIGVSILV